MLSHGSGVANRRHIAHANSLFVVLHNSFTNSNLSLCVIAPFLLVHSHIRLLMELIIVFALTGKEDVPHLPPNSIFQPTGIILGQGAYGDVLEVLYKGKLYAAKKYRFTAFKAFGQEHEMTRICFHRNVVPYYCIGKLETDKSTVVVMERMDKNLDTYLTQGKIALPVKFQILTDIANGLNHLHQQNPAIIHRDLKATNNTNVFGRSCKNK